MKTLTHQDFRPLSLQLSALFADDVLTGQRVLAELYPAVKDFFGGEPVVLPLPPLDQVPLQFVKQIPHVTLKSDTGWLCQTFVGTLRLTYTGSAGVSADLRGSTEQAAELLRRFLGALGRPSLERMGLVFHRVAEHDTPGLFLARHFCKERWDIAPLNRPESFELHAHKVCALPDSGTRVNSWARNKSAQLTTGTQASPVVLFEQDMNTLVDGPSIAPEEAPLLVAELGAELDTVLQLYYPETGSLEP